MIRVKLRELIPLEKNARYMSGPQFNRLVENLRKDGVLTSVPLVVRQERGLVIASGNHRVAAAIKAGIQEADALEVLTPLTRQQFVGLQLSHNAITGQDDPNVLRELYEELAFEWKEYSGLTDDAFNVEDLDTSVLRVEKPFYEELHVSFLPDDAEVFRAWLDKIGRSNAAAERMVGMYSDFDAFFGTLLAVKQVRGVHNTAVALRLMAELAGSAIAAGQAGTEKSPQRRRKHDRESNAAAGTAA